MGLVKLKSIKFTMPERWLIDVVHTPGINCSCMSCSQYQIMIIFLLFVRFDKNSEVVIVPVNVSAVLYGYTISKVGIYRKRNCVRKG